MRDYFKPLDAITRTIEINILEQLGETDLPAPLQPERYALPISGKGR